MGDRYPVNCGVNSDGNRFVIIYNLGTNVDKSSISWKWEPSQKGSYVAKLEANTHDGDVKYHNSAPIPAEIHSQLGTPIISNDGKFYKVEVQRNSVTDIKEFFEVAQ